MNLSPNPSFIRPRTSDRPVTRGESNDNPLPIPSRTSSLHSRITQPIPATLNSKMSQRTPKTLTHAYMVCGVGREPSQWLKAPPPPQGKITHMKGAVNQFWLPEILGSSPRIEQDNDIARALHAAMRACFPHDVEICTGRTQPHCVHHTFVLQQDSSHTLYGIALRVWSRADEKRAETIRDLRRRTESDYHDIPDETYWIPYALSFLSRYPLFNLLGDYLRGMWIHWNKATNLFHAEEVSRILSFPAPRLNDLVRIDMKDYALCYQFPSSPTGFQNFSMWPLFCCLSIPNITGVIEAALSPTRRIIFLSHYPAILTVAAETIRYCTRVYEWSGLYVPVVHARHARDLVQEPGPYILGITAECRVLFTAPSDALVVDLDRNFVLTSSPPTALKPGQRNKMIQRLTQALHGDVPPTGVPQHLRSAYGGGKLVPAGQIIVMRGEVESTQDPEWWDQDAVMAVMDHVCDKMGRNTGIKAVFGGSVKKPLMTKVSLRHLNEIVRERNQYSRDATEAWQDFINLKGRMDTELTKVNKRNNFLVEELESWKQQFEKFQSFASQLTKEAQELKAKIEAHKRENRRLTSLIEQQKDDSARLSLRLSTTEKQRDDALEALVMQQEVAEELERDRKRNKKEILALEKHSQNILRQRDEAQRVVLHLRSLIEGQAHHMEHIVKSLGDTPEISQYIGEEYDDEDERTVTTSKQTPSPSRAPSRSTNLSRASTIDGKPMEGEDVSEDMESRFFNNSARSSRRYSQISMTDVADRHLRDKTDAIAHIIRNISEQCARAVDNLQLARNVAHEDEREPEPKTSKRGSRTVLEEVDTDDTVLLSPRDGVMSMPPTPDLIHRSSTALSMISTRSPDRNSMQYGDIDVPTRIVEVDDTESALGTHDEEGHGDELTVSYKNIEGPITRSGARVSAFGSA
ncbi:AEX-3 domain-containing protein [Peziza echinospora]|nr:AEX-3 domain-containing protein [Peziza echinospora]